MVAEALGRISVPFAMFNQREFATAELSVEVAGEQPTGRIRLDGRSYALEGISGVYTRLMDDRLLPELADEPEDSPVRRRCRALHDALTRWADIAPGRVVNRTAPMASNGSKPYQAQLIQALGFAVPETLITDDPEAVAEFAARHGRVIFKSISGQRSIVRTLESTDAARLDTLTACPVMFQRHIEGTDVRVHTVGERVFATAIGSSATDYRYAHLDGGTSELTAIDLPDALAERCAALSTGLGLDFAGIDLRLTTEGEAVCFEVNPCPAFSYYESHTGQPIADAVARHLAGR
jgi:glutathione synthase/RimK-type ligase-like ATP-grasp enzyme